MITIFCCLLSMFTKIFLLLKSFLNAKIWLALLMSGKTFSKIAVALSYQLYSRAGKAWVCHVCESISKSWLGNSLLVQWLELHAFIAGGTNSISGWGTQIPDAMAKKTNWWKQASVPLKKHWILGAQRSQRFFIYQCYHILDRSKLQEFQVFLTQTHQGLSHMWAKPQNNQH